VYVAWRDLTIPGSPPSSTVLCFNIYRACDTWQTLIGPHSTQVWKNRVIKNFLLWTPSTGTDSKFGEDLEQGELGPAKDYICQGPPKIFIFFCSLWAHFFGPFFCFMSPSLLLQEIDWFCALWLRLIDIPCILWSQFYPLKFLIIMLALRLQESISIWNLRRNFFVFLF